MTDTVLNTEIPELQLKSRGKVRDIYDLGDRLLIVTTDRISAFDVVLPTPIPEKGEVLTALSKFWFEKTGFIIENQMCDERVEDVLKDKKLAKELSPRSVIVKKAIPLPVEAIVRGYLTGSGLKEYLQTGKVSRMKLPDGLVESSKLSEPIFTPSTKAQVGLHDENISFEEMKNVVDPKISEQVKKLSIEIYKFAADYALSRGIIIADTKFEFGMLDGKLILIDEALTPDSSRFWPAASYKEGESQPSFDKQFVRDWLTSSGWNKKPPAPELPPDVVRKTSEKYKEALRRLCALSPKRMTHDA